MITEISSLVASSKAAYEIAKGLSSLKAEVERNEAISKILEVLVAVQFQASAVLSKTHELEAENHNLTKRLMEFENWSETERQYNLKEIAPSVFVYAYKKTEDSSKPEHWLCTKCFHEKKQHIIQLSHTSAAGKHYFCPNCNTKN